MTVNFETGLLMVAQLSWAEGTPLWTDGEMNEMLLRMADVKNPDGRQEKPVSKDILRGSSGLPSQQGFSTCAV